MDQAYLISLVEGFYPFGKRSKTNTRKQQSLSHADDLYERSAGMAANVPAVIANPSAAETGVSRYISALPVDSGVAKYLKKNPSGPATRVSKYLAEQSIKGRVTERMTGVSKYLTRFDSSNAPSGVAKYVAKQIIQTKYLPKRTTVGKYITRLEIAEAKAVAALTQVGKYQAEQDRLQRKLNAQKLIERCLEQEARQAAEKAAAQAALVQDSDEASVGAVEEDIAETAVGRYMQSKARIDSEKPRVSKVAKYIAQLAVIESLKPRQTGVARYLVKTKVYKPKPVVSSVTKYLEAQALAAKTKPVYSGVSKYLIRQRIEIQRNPLKISGVTKYLAQHAHELRPAAPVLSRSVLSGVAKYLDRQQAAAEVSRAAQSEVSAEICLEGEFIPAAEALPSEAESVKPARATRVSKYIDEHQAANRKVGASKAKNPTRVDKYLQAAS